MSYLHTVGHTVVNVLMACLSSAAGLEKALRVELLWDTLRFPKAAGVLLRVLLTFSETEKSESRPWPPVPQKPDLDLVERCPGRFLLLYCFQYCCC